MKRFIVLVSRDIVSPDYETDGSATLFIIAFNSISSRPNLSTVSKFFSCHFFHVRVDQRKEKKKREREEEREKKKIYRNVVE